jgi:hypothetical protein
MFAGLAGGAVSALYDGTAHAMAGIMCAMSIAGVILHGALK